MTSGAVHGRSAAAHGERYESNATLAQIAERLRIAKKVAILTHSKPDGDAVGSSVALARAMKSIGATATPVFLPPWSPRMDAMVGETPIIHEAHGIWNHQPLTEVDCVAIVDTGSWTQIADARAWLEPRHDMAVVIDHHAHGDAGIAAMRHVETTAASATQLVAEVCRVLLGVRGYQNLPVEIAEPLYLGLATDTGWFRHSNVTPAVLRMAADLMDAGVDQNRLYRLIEQSDSLKRLMLIERALTSLEMLKDDRLAVISISRADITACDASQDELGGLSDLPMTVGSVQVVAVLTEIEPQLTKVSFRSKAADPPACVLDVNAIAKSLGGGGHIHAAGAKVRAPLAEAREQVVKAVLSAFP